MLTPMYSPHENMLDVCSYLGSSAAYFLHHLSSTNIAMAKGGMKKAAATAMSKGAIAESLANSCELKKGVVSKLLGSLAEVGQAEVKKSGVFTIPGLARIKTRRKPATKAAKRMMFGQEVVVKAKPAKTVVKAFPVAALKKVI